MHKGSGAEIACLLHVFLELEAFGAAASATVASISASAAVAPFGAESFHRFGFGRALANTSLSGVRARFADIVSAQDGRVGGVSSTS